MRNATVKADFGQKDLDAQILALLIDFSDRVEEMAVFCSERAMVVDWQRVVLSLCIHYNFMIKTLVDEMCVNGIEIDVNGRKYPAQIENTFVIFNSHTYASSIILTVTSNEVVDAIACGDLPRLPCHDKKCIECRKHLQVIFAKREGVKASYDDYAAIPLENWSVATAKRLQGALLC